MKHVSVRKAGPWLVGLAALALFPLGGVNASSAPARAVAVSNTGTEQTVGTLTLDHRASLKATAAQPQAKASRSAVETLPQLPAKLGGFRAAPTKSAAPLTVPSVSPTLVNGAPTPVTSFDGINSYQNRRVSSGGNQFTLTPPDQGLCVGNSLVFEIVNDSVSIYTKAGATVLGPIGINAFLGYPYEINRTTGVYGPEPTDPSCYFDVQTQRWFVAVLTLETNPTTGALTLVNHLDIAVSETNDPTGEWEFYHVAATDDGTQGTPNHTSCPCLGDYPHIGADANGFYITTNEYPWGTGPGVFGNNWNGAQIYAFPKAKLAANADKVKFVHIAHLATSNGVPGFTLWPSEVPGTAFDARANGTEWFSESTAAVQETLNPAGMSDNIVIWRLTNTVSLNHDPELHLSNTTLTSPTYGVPPQSEQKYGPVPLRDCLQVACLPGIGPSRNEVESAIDSNDSRMQSNWLANNTLMTALDTIVNVNGLGRYEAGIAWFFVDVSAAPTLSLPNAGYVAVSGNITYPSIATLANGNGAMAMTLVGNDYFPSAAYMAVGPTGPSGLVNDAAPGLGPDDEFCGYLFYNCTNTPTPGIRPRWGDYGAAAIDGTEVWIASEYIGQTCTNTQYAADPTCGNTRAPLSNWFTRITQVS